jgi:hypothetical protein
MKKILEYLETHQQETQRLLGIKYEKLNKLLERAIELHNKKQEQEEAVAKRLVKKGAGRKPKLSLEEQVILTLTYLRHLTTFQLLGIQFGVSETTANDLFNYWWPIIRELLPESLLEEVKKTKKSTKSLENY